MKKIILCSFLLLALCSTISFASCNSSAQSNSNPEELVIVAHVTIDPEYQDQMIKVFDAVVKGTRQEPGCVSYVLHQHVDNPQKFTFVEVWKSQAAIKAHNESAHFQEFAKAIEGKASLEVYTMKKKF
ncbi:quinol monooxygenase YgiN [Parabacteroides sp. PF5-5]|uniref:putative quinol monooxygenase n=1 Tax=unclassified Parabacteroides TaxID=2649774 RepID=UPI002474024F|nr:MULTISPECIES: putative quinol monooxygenase [unclassified Parabacteroides]MDH6305123.1 quinol monooxygenase YgiN [Parabacteroides sp. PH5-39]MDH6316473.1 quinol monooxygenase YgiN [Parabacteroides sp. PF5-13]MDH6319983.1 quinol monooxygenase YgiN [Parabacteroides sp. PH5-13]MDH6323784.1 quinol monooxygenase YgiN [Parabacteroides sp. PH5-8]MDH6327660.1 quinol monooxygenase YgiN [Parabacteroides sp. PH5-41]